jgi:PAS domain S-box-containing protein
MSDIHKFTEDDYKALFYGSQSANLIININAPLYSILDVNYKYLEITGTTRESLIGQPLFVVFPPYKTEKQIEMVVYSLRRVMRTKRPHALTNYRYDVFNPEINAYEERYWTTTNTPVLDEKGDIKYIIHSPTDVTELNELSKINALNIQSLHSQRQELKNIFMQAPVGIMILKGKEFILELANPSIYQFLGNHDIDIIGKPFFIMLPHFKGYGYEEHLNDVMNTGEPFVANRIAVKIIKNGTELTVYINFVYEPLKNPDGSVYGVIVIAHDVTDQVKAINKLEEAEERARLAVDAVNLGTFDLDMKTNKLVTSARFNEIFGYKDFLSRSMYVAAVHPDDQQIRLEAHRKAIKTGSIFYEVRIFLPHGALRWIRAEGKIYYDEEKNPVRMLGTVLDITEQKNNREEQQKLSLLVNNSADLMSILTLDGQIQYINKAGKNLLGIQADEPVYRIPINKLTQADDYYVKEEIFPCVLKEGKWAGRINMKHLNTGEIIPVYNNSIRIDDPETHIPLGIGSVMRDLRSELDAASKLAERDLILTNLTTAVPIGLWMSDSDGNITYVNQTWINWTGINLEKQIGVGWLTAILPQDRLKTLNKFRRDVQFIKPYEAEFRIIHVDGQEHYCLATGQPQFKSDNTFVGYIGACVDITEQKNLQKQKDDFIGIASHELKTPVTSIKAYAQILERMLVKKDCHTEAQMVNKMDGQINRLTNLIGDLLDVTKINSGKLLFNEEQFDFDQLVSELLEELQRTTDKNLVIKESVNIGLVFADRERIGQVITNLITNAIKYSPSAKLIIIRKKILNKQVQFSVEDFGIGIAKDKLEKVFERFYRIDGDMQHTFPGLGLGLYISSEIVKRNEGKIWVESTLGGGSQFYFCIPLNKNSKKGKESMK